MLRMESHKTNKERLDRVEQVINDVRFFEEDFFFNFRLIKYFSS